MPDFQIVSPFQPEGDQPAAIEQLVARFRDGHQFQTLLGVTGSGKTFTMAHTIESLRRPALIISHNKTLAAQLYEEFRELFPENAVEYFVSYYDYYQPEAYIPQRDIYIEKDASRNDELDRLRLAATSSLTSRQDVIIIASVSCIFGLGSPEEYKRMVVAVRKDLPVDRDTLLERLVEIQYERCGVEFKRGTFRVLGDIVEIYPAYEQFAYRVQLFGDQVEQIDLINPLTNEPLSEAESIFIYPAKHYVMPEDRISSAVASIGVELESRLSELRTHGKLLEAQRLAARTKYDMEMIQEVGYCSGIENYARHLANLPPGSRPYTLIDYFPKDFLLMIDESHATIPQLNAMFNGDRQRKLTLVEHGFRLPSALDNRPLRFEEFRENWHQALFVSATPGPFELELCRGEVVEQIIRPTGLLDPQIEVHSARDQVSDLLVRIKQRVAAKQRVLVTTLTKRLAEDLAEYISSEGIRCEYLHSEINTLERVEILRNLRRGKFDVLVGVNLLREGLDLPEVSMVAILDADKEGFLRSETSLIQMIGRTARNIDAIVVLYADKITPSMRRAIDETERRRQKQEQFNTDHGITPQTIVKEIREGLDRQLKAQRIARGAIAAEEEDFDRGELIQQLEREMLEAAENLEFEKAAELRDRLAEVKQMPEIDGSKKAKAGVMPQSKRSRSREKRKRAMDR